MNPATRLMIEKLNELALQGMSYAQAAAVIDGKYHYVAGFSRRYGIPFRLEQRGRKLGSGREAAINERSEEMRALYIDGQTLEQIGKKFGISRERVRQILTLHYGMRAPNGGKAVASRKARKEFNRKRDARHIKHWGCSYREYQKILKHPDLPTRAFASQRQNAKKRGIEWSLSLWQWWKIWEQSGHWAERGRGRGYCMCRLNDCGPYSVDNVYIATGAENMRDYWVNKHAQSSLEAA